MKARNGFAYFHVVLIAAIAEFILIAVQFIYLKFYISNSDPEFAFTTEYMKSRGFYIFQIVGFFLYTTIVYFIIGKLYEKVFNKLLLLVAAGGIIELTFYIVMQAGYEGAFLYSILDKIIAAAFGTILFNYTTDRKKRPKSYF